ncbi:MAG: hypothetical protein AB9907_05720 [Flexilinea sp.]
MKLIKKIIPHISIIISGMMIVFFIIDRFNPKMGFLDNEGTKILTFILSVSSITTSILLVGRQRRE